MIQRLSVNGLKITRGDRVLFEGLSFLLSAGEAISVAGANGSGKTSLLRAIAGGSPSTGGTIVFEGQEGPLDTDEVRAQNLHFLGHNDGLKTSRTAGDELMFWGRWTGAGEDALRKAAQTLSLTSLLNLPVGSISAGQRRRLALARLVAAPRAVWLLDEPLAPMDATHRRRFGEVMTHHLAQGGMILAATHDPLPVPSRTLTIGPP